MNGTLTCECGTELLIAESMARLTCPDCQTVYAVTITELGRARLDASKERLHNV